MPAMASGFIAEDAQGPSFRSFGIQMPGTFSKNAVTWRLGDNHIVQTFRDACPNSQLRAETPLPANIFDFRGKKHEQWRKEIPLFETLIYSEIYPGIDVVYKTVNQELKRDFLIAPGGDPTTIRMHFEGAANLCIGENGNLLIESGPFQFQETTPFAYQDFGNQRKVVSCHFQLNAFNEVSFVIGDYDSSWPLIIDPTILATGSFGGSNSDSTLASFATDSALYFTGRTNSADFPILGAQQSQYAGDSHAVGDAFLACFDKSTLALNYATFFGGSGSDQATGIFVDHSGNAFIGGWTNSTDFPTLNAHQSTLGGSASSSAPFPSDGFVARFDSNGVLQWSTYLGGEGDDQFADLDGSSLFQKITVVGFSNSTDYPIKDADDPTCGCSNGSGSDAVFTRFNYDGSLDVSTYLGGNTGSPPPEPGKAANNAANDVALDVFVLGETAYISGWTQSFNFPKQPFTANHAGGQDAFFALYGFDGRRDFSILIGGSGDDVGDGVAAFSQSQVVLSGSTTSLNDFPITTNAQQPSYGGGPSDAFIARINTISSPRLRYVSFWGGAGTDAGREVVFSKAPSGLLDRYTIAGVTNSTNMPIGNNTTASTNGGLDGFVVTGEVQGANDFNIFTGLTYGGAGEDGIFSLSASISDGPFSLLAAGTTSDATVLPLATPNLDHSRETAARNGGDDESFWILYCPENCVLPQKHDLSLSITIGSSDPIEMGQLFHYNVRVENLSPTTPAPNAQLNILIPNCTIDSLVNGPTNCTISRNRFESVLDCNLGTMQPGQVITFRINAVFDTLQLVNDPAGVTTTRGLVQPVTTDLDPQNNLAFVRFAANSETLGIGNRVSEGALSVGDPISTANGALHFEIPLLDLGGPLPLATTLYYRSNMLTTLDQIALPSFWIKPFAALLPNISSNGSVYSVVQMPNGDLISFQKSGSTWQKVTADLNLGFGISTGNSLPTPYLLKEQAGWFYFCDPVKKHVYIFQDLNGSSSILRAVMDRNGNAHTYIYGLGDAFPPTAVEDGLGRRLEFEYVSLGGQLNHYLSKITDQGGRDIHFSYDSSAADNAGDFTLRSITDAMGQQTRFEYAGPDYPSQRITRQVLANGDGPLRQTYEFENRNGFRAQRITAQAHTAAPKNHMSLTPVETLRYDALSSNVVHTDLLGNAWEYQTTHHHGQTTRILDPQGFQTDVTVDPNHFIQLYDDRNNGQYSFTHHPATGAFASLTTPMGNVYQRTFRDTTQTFSNPINGDTFQFNFSDNSQILFPDGSQIRCDFDFAGNKTRVVDRAGNDYLFTYNQAGQLLTQQNPTGGLINFSYDAHGNVASMSSSETGTFIFNRDAWFRITQTTFPNGLSQHFGWNHNNRLVQMTNTRAQTTRATYDALNNLTQLTGPDTHCFQFDYNRFSILEQILDPSMRQKSAGLNDANQTTEFNDGSGDLETYTYNQAGFRIAVDRGGVGFVERRDGEGQLVGYETANGQFQTQYLRDPESKITQLVSPAGRRYHFGYDPLGRIASIQQPSGSETVLHYDANGNWIGRTSPGNTTLSLTRNGLGHVTDIRDADGHHWLRRFSPLGLIQNLTDPLGRVTDFQYNPNGQLNRVTFRDNSTLDIHYNGTLISQLAFTSNVMQQGPNNLTLSFGYDPRGNLTSADGITLGYDAARRLTNWSRNGTNFSQTYDAAGRLATLNYLNNTMVVSYAYNDRGLLDRVSDSLTGTVITFVYDNRNQKIATLRSNGTSAGYQFNADGFLVELRESLTNQAPFIDLQYTFDADGNLTGEAMTVPLEPEDFLIEGQEIYAFDAASQISTQGYAFDDRGRQTHDPSVGSLEWDLASRLVRIGHAQLEYDGLGHLTSLTQTTTTNFHTHPGFKNTAILLEQSQNTGPDSRDIFYVYSPEGQLLYLINRRDNNEPHFFHFDLKGNTLAVSNGSGQLTHAFAYDPLGREIGQQAQRSGLNFKLLHKTRGQDAGVALLEAVLLLGREPKDYANFRNYAPLVEPAISQSTNSRLVTKGPTLEPKQEGIYGPPAGTLYIPSNYRKVHQRNFIFGPNGIVLTPYHNGFSEAEVTNSTEPSAGDLLKPMIGNQPDPVVFEFFQKQPSVFESFNAPLTQALLLPDPRLIPIGGNSQLARISEELSEKFTQAKLLASLRIGHHFSTKSSVISHADTERQVNANLRAEISKNASLPDSVKNYLNAILEDLESSTEKQKPFRTRNLINKSQK